MQKGKIALIIDSCTDVPKEYIEKYNMYVLPMTINYKDKSYIDGIDITADEVYENLKIEVPKTSLPSGEIIKNTFEKIIDAGYEKIIAVTVSSGLSGTNNIVNIIAKDYQTVETYVVDSKNISLGAGLIAITAGELIEKNYSFEIIKEKLMQVAKNTKIFFCVETLEYLKRGGRIGLVTCAVGTLLELKPIISCNEDGIYYNVTKCIGRKNSIKKTIEMAEKYAKSFNSCKIAIGNGHAYEEATNMAKKIKEELRNIKYLIESSISPALGVHTGPGLIGVVVQEFIE